jgi:hypothetical protein
MEALDELIPPGGRVKAREVLDRLNMGHNTGGKSALFSAKQALGIRSEMETHPGVAGVTWWWVRDQ